MENETGSQNKTVIQEEVLEELLEKVKKGSELSGEEMDNIIYKLLYKTTVSSLLAEKEKKKAGGLKVTFLTLVGRICGRQTKFLPYVLQYRKEAANLKCDNFAHVLEGLQITSVNVCRENLWVLVEQFEKANEYSETFDQLYDEVEEGLADGLGSFAGFVGMESMIKMDAQRNNVLKLSKKYKK